MKKEETVSLLFIIAALYDGVLGVLFLFAGGRVFEWIQVTPPNHPGYVQFPAALLIVFALMFCAIARKPLLNKNLIPYGMLLKVSYCGVVFFHWFAAGIPNMWKPFAIFDLAFLGLFIWAYASLREMTATSTSTRLTKPV
ncbi:MAG: hypothetical protein ABSF37_11635 [Sedimentisphaerales bacterium]|jgi:hypothetical protein